MLTMNELKNIKKEIVKINLLVDNLVGCKKHEDKVRVVALIVIHVVYLEHLLRLIIEFVQAIIDYYFTEIPVLKNREMLLLPIGRETSYIKKTKT